MNIYTILYLLVGLIAFILFWRYVADESDEYGNHIVGICVLFAWPLCALIGILGIVYVAVIKLARMGI